MNDLPITLFDLIVGGVVLLSMLLGFARGAVREAFGLATWIGAIVAAIYLFQPVRPLMVEAIGNELLADAATLAVVFFVPFLVLKVLTTMIANAVASSMLGPIDKTVGLAFGFARGALIVCAAYLVGSVFVAPERHPDWVRTAELQPHVAAGAEWLAQFLPPGILDAGREAASQAALDAAERARQLRQVGDGAAQSLGYADRARERMDELIGGRVE
jgi:membrane protein required for colicin V production